MKRKILNPLFFLLLFFPVISLFGTEATVNDWNLRIFTLPGDGKALYSLQPGTVVDVDRVNAYYSRVTFRGNKGWVKTSGLAFYNGVFSHVQQDRPFLFKHIILESGKDMLYYYKNGKIFKYNASEHTLVDSQKVKEISGIHPASRDGVFLLEGITTNDYRTFNYAVFHYGSGKMINIGSFSERHAYLVDAAFSDNSEFLALSLVVDDQYLTCVYRTSDGELLGCAKRARHAAWYGNTVILNSHEYFWTYNMSDSIQNLDISYQKERDFIRMRGSYLIGGEAEYKVVGDQLYLNTYSGVISVDMKSKEIKKTPFLGLSFNQDSSLNYFYQGGKAYLKNLRENRYYPDFQGAEPKIDFVAFTGTNIICRTKFEKIDTLFVYSPELKEIYRYKAIDDPMAVGEDGTIAEITMEKNMMLLSIESPEQQGFYFVFEKEKE